MVGAQILIVGVGGGLDMSLVVVDPLEWVDMVTQHPDFTHPTTIGFELPGMIHR